MRLGVAAALAFHLSRGAAMVAALPPIDDDLDRRVAQTLRTARLRDVMRRVARGRRPVLLARKLRRA